MYSLVNGEKNSFLPVDDRAIQYGDGLFETLPCISGQLYFWPEHYARLKQSCQRLKLDCPDDSVLLEDIRQLDEQIDYDATRQSMVIKIIISRGSAAGSSAGRGYRYTSNFRPVRIVSASVIENTYSSLLSARLLAGELCLCRQPASINPALAGMKHLNRLENVMARNEWDDDAENIIDGVMCDAFDNVIECTSSNLFAVDHDGVIYTPDLANAGVDGVMRNVILSWCEQCGLAVEIKAFDTERLRGMREVFITNSLIGLKSVTRFDDTSYTSDEVAATLFTKMIATLDKNRHASV